MDTCCSAPSRPGSSRRASADSHFPSGYVPDVPSAYLSQKLTRPLVTKDGGTLRTVLDARAYMLALSKDRKRRAQWQRAAELLLAQADVAETRPKP